ncbi:hypothetical protein OG196_20055 [Kitasatospora purpeofusca]|uniref:hypothetical protein n=1 Tax=Kitasatospora purpeofusca TaxID=67352 RepID=UPI002E14250B|nr:hypothetical protein OG196_20055 [Kitasatospora purpeofusca]
MSRGRHRHSSVLGRVFPPTAAGVLLVAALGALLFSQDTVLVRSVGAAAVLATLGFAVLLRQRDRAARAAAEVSAAQRLRAEERFEEQLAEAEYAAEVAEERATRFGRRLTAEKSRLAKAETEIARLLKERAVAVAAQALKEAEAAQRALAASRPEYPASPAAFVRAGSVLRQLERRAAQAEAQRERAALREAERAAERERAAGAEVALRARTAPATTSAPVSEPKPERVAPVVPAPVAPGVPAPGTAPSARSASGAATPVPAAPVRPVLTATVGQLGGAPSAQPVRPAERQRPRPTVPATARPQGFSFFGRGAGAGAGARPAAPTPVVGSVAELGERADLADVVGDEVVAAQAQEQAQAQAQIKAEAEAEARAEARVQDAVPAAGGVPEDAEERTQVLPRVGRPTAPEVVDLTPHDETEQIEVPELRASR